MKKTGTIKLVYKNEETLKMIADRLSDCIIRIKKQPKKQDAETNLAYIFIREH